MLRRCSVVLIGFFATSYLLAQDPTLPGTSSDEQILHVLNRLTFGPGTRDIQAVRDAGVEKWIQSQLHPETIEENPSLHEKLKPLSTLTLNRSESLEAFNNSTRVMLQDGAIITRNVSQDGTIIFRNTESIRGPMTFPRTSDEDLKDGKIYRAVYSNRQLEEVLVDFWFNHFNVSYQKANPYVADYEREAIRPHVLGKFQDMLTATAFHPAMMLYLDNKESIAPEIAQPGPNMTVLLGRARGLNENYSRELMELHTLGVDGGYTQKDIEAAARTFTGLSLQPKTASIAQGEPAKVEVLFYSWAHDPNDKVVLGETITAGGSEEVLKLLEILARHPSTARHISKRLAQRFVADSPPQALVDRMAKTFRETDGDLREVMTTMLTSPEFFAEDVRQGKIKSPLELVTSAVRATNGEVTNPAALATRVAAMGQPLYNKAEPTGYPNTGENWINAARLVERVSLGTDLVNGKITGVAVAPSQWDGKDTLSIARQILGRDPAPQTLESLKKGTDAGNVSAEVAAGLVLASPDFQRR